MTSITVVQSWTKLSSDSSTTLQNRRLTCHKSATSSCSMVS